MTNYAGIQINAQQISPNIVTGSIISTYDDKLYIIKETDIDNMAYDSINRSIVISNAVAIPVFKDSVYKEIEIWHKETNSKHSIYTTMYEGSIIVIDKKRYITLTSYGNKIVMYSIDNRSTEIINMNDLTAFDISGHILFDKFDNNQDGYTNIAMSMLLYNAIGDEIKYTSIWKKDDNGILRIVSMDDKYDNIPAYDYGNIYNYFIDKYEKAIEDLAIRGIGTGKIMVRKLSVSINKADKVNALATLLLFMYNMYKGTYTYDKRICSRCGKPIKSQIYISAVTDEIICKSCYMDEMEVADYKISKYM